MAFYVLIIYKSYQISYHIYNILWNLFDHYIQILIHKYIIRTFEIIICSSARIKFVYVRTSQDREDISSGSNVGG